METILAFVIDAFILGMGLALISAGVVLTIAVTIRLVDHIL